MNLGVGFVAVVELVVAAVEDKYCSRVVKSVGVKIFVRIFAGKRTYFEMKGAEDCGGGWEVKYSEMDYGSGCEMGCGSGFEFDSLN